MNALSGKFEEVEVEVPSPINERMAEVVNPLEEGESEQPLPETWVHSGKKMHNGNQQQEVVKLQQELHECARRHGRRRADILTLPRKRTLHCHNL